MHPLQALAVLALVCNPKSGWQLSGRVPGSAKVRPAHRIHMTNAEADEEFGTKRRALLFAAAASSIPFRSRALDVLPLTLRLDAARLMPLSSSMDSVTGDLRYPGWLAGTWRVASTNVGFSMPLGSRFVDRYLVAEARKGAGKVLQYTMRFIEAPAPLGQPALTIRQDRRFNAMQEESASISSMGFTVERGSYVCDSAHPHGRVLLDILDLGEPGSANGKATGSSSNKAYEVKAAVRSKSEVDIVWAAWDAPDSGDTFVTSEHVVQRELLPIGTNGAATEELGTTFLELITRFERPAMSSTKSERPPIVHARFREVTYLGLPGIASPITATKAERMLEKQAAGQAVAILDYDLVMERVG